ncbi:hypothetical protein Dsin_007251 [Dipteronia sinensis]|uniref:YqgF/RNase H-like domain-containing protein n=1 Tax=Dipteronia sinensis TaxID=43782 RepID=A0AAE0B1H5_9ROSI|nr:hypothetical protein Dsin_007251 [Dipteronia sinensis]
MEYLEPLDFYEKIFKDNSKKKYHQKPGRLLCFDVSVKYVSLAVSDWKNKTAVPLRALDRQEISPTSNVADLFQSLISEYNIVGFVVGTRNTNSIDAETQIFIADLCEAGNFREFKYSTCIASENGEFIFKQILNFVSENLKLSLPRAQNIMEKPYAVCALQTYLDDMNKMLDGSNKKSIRSGTSTMPFDATRPSSSYDTVPQMECLMPLNFYKEIFKDILRNGYDWRLLGLHVGEKYVSLSVSDWKNKTAVPLRALDRQEINLTSNVADLFQSLIYEHNIVGFVIGTSRASIDAPTQNLIDNLCKDGKFKVLKYTIWDCSITSKHAEFVFNRHLEFILENLNQPENLNRTVMEMCYAVPALQGYLDITNKMLEEDWNI